MRYFFLLIALFIFSSISVFSQMSGYWDISDTSYAEYVVNNRYPSFANTGSESIVMLAGIAYPRPHYLKRTLDSGKTWQKVFETGFYYNLLSVAHPSKNTITITGDTLIYQGYDQYYNSFYQHYGFITVSKDAGLTWNSTVLDSNTLVYGLSMCDENNGIAIQRVVANRYYSPEFFYDTLLVTNDCWATYYKVVLPDGIQFSEMAYCFSPDIFYIRCYNSEDKKQYLYRTLDGGSNWDKIEIPVNILQISFLNQNQLWACGSEKISEGNYKPVIYKSSNCFLDYDSYYPNTEFLLSNANSVLDISFSDELNGIAVGTSCMILRTEDGGNTWTQDDLPYLNGLSLKYDAFSIAKSILSNLAFVAENSTMILKYEGKKVLSSPKLIKHKYADDVYDIPIEFTTVDGAEQYHFQLAKNNTNYYGTACYDTSKVMDTVIVVQPNDTNKMKKLFLLQAEYNYSYYGRVKAINSTSESQWGETAPVFWTFKANNYVEQPFFIKPIEKEIFNSDNIKFLWTNCGTGLTYDFQISTDAQVFSYFIVFDSTDIADTTLDLSNKLDLNTTYYARVRVHPDVKQSYWSYVSFQVTEPSNVDDDMIITDNLSITPNPVDNILQISIPNNLVNDNSNIEIYSLTGNKLFEYELNGNNFMKMDVSSLHSGIYLIKINDIFCKFMKL